MLWYHISNLNLIVDYKGDLDEQNFTSIYAFLLNVGDISWRSKKQSYISLSTIEAEVIAFSAATQGTIWLRQFLQNIHVTRQYDCKIEKVCQ